MYSWRQRLIKSNPDFIPVRVVQKRRHHKVESHGGTMTAVSVSPSELDVKSPTVRVILPNGVRFEGLEPEQAIEIVRRLSGEATF
jgi:hypothetical protein